MNTLEAYKEVLQTHCYSFKKPDLLYRFVGDIVGRGLLFSEGAEHKRQRRILQGVFTPIRASQRDEQLIDILRAILNPKHEGHLPSLYREGPIIGRFL